MLKHLALAAAILAVGGCAKQTGPVESLVWPPPPEPARVVSSDTLTTSHWSNPPSAFRRLVTKITGRRKDTGFQKPYGVVADDRGRVFVSDTGWGDVLVFDKAEKSFRFLGGEGQGALSKPAGITVDGRGHVFVADLGLALVMEFDADLGFVRSYGSGVFVRPVGVAVDDATGTLWASDTKRHVLDAFEVGGGHLRTLGERGQEDGNFNFPTNLDVGPDGNLYVVDSMNFRIQVLGPDGTFVRKWGKNCDVYGCLAKAKGVSVAPDGRVFVVDAAFNMVQIFDADGTMLLFFGGHGNLPGRVVLPAGIHVADDRQVYLVSQYNWRVNIYDYIGDEADTVDEPGSSQRRSSPVDPVR